MKEILISLKSWQTTAVGFLSGLAILATQLVHLLDDDDKTQIDMEMVYLSLGLMGIGTLAKDGSASSKKLGIE